LCCCCCLCCKYFDNYNQQDFDNDGFFNDVTIEPPATNIAMIPPVTDSEANITVQFEPLPDMRVLHNRQQPEISDSTSNINVSQLRPKIAQISHDRVDSDDEGDSQTCDMLLLQERVKLEKILCKQFSRY